MEFSIKEYGKHQEAEILNLYGSVGWANYVNNPDMLKNAYANSLKILGAYEGEKLLGVIRVVGDGCSVVVIQDINRMQGISKNVLTAGSPLAEPCVPTCFKENYYP